MNISYWVNRWVEAARVTLASSIPWKETLLNIWEAESNNYTLADNQSIDSWDWEEFRQYNGRWTSDIVLFNGWDAIYWLYGRMNNEKNWWPWGNNVNGKVILYAAPLWFNPYSNWNTWGSLWQGTYWWIEWLSDENWDIRYSKV
jgi:hypothetical protein